MYDFKCLRCKNFQESILEGFYCEYGKLSSNFCEKFEKREDNSLALRECTTDELRAELKRRNEKERKEKEAMRNSAPTCRNCAHVQMRKYNVGYECTIRFSDKSKRFHKCVKPSEACEDFARKTE